MLARVPMLARLPWLERTIARIPVSRLPSLRITLLVIVPALAVPIALVAYLLGGGTVATDNAYIGAQKVLVTPEVSGKVVRIAVTEGQRLKPGDELIAIDPAPYRFAAREAEARLMRVRSEFAALKASLKSAARQIALARQTLDAARADFDRKRRLASDRISSQSDLDRARLTLTAAQARLEQLEQRAQAARIQLIGNPDLPIEKYPQFIAANVALQRAKRDLANTVLRAPIAGVATRVSSIQMGRYLTAGMAVFSIVGSDKLWIDANPKETDIAHVRPGQPVTITVDAFPSRQWKGTVGAISPGTGAEFAIPPPQNAAGNWIKVVQRVPLRVEFAPGQNLRRLRAGMSATIVIDTGRRSRLARMLGAAAVADQGGDP